jgi:hypothetical protein
MDFVGGTIDVFGSLPDIVVNSRNLGLAHPVGPHDPGAKPLRMVDQDMKRRPLDGNARFLEPDTQLGENIVNEALIARAVCQPVHDIAVRSGTARDALFAYAMTGSAVELDVDAAYAIQQENTAHWQAEGRRPVGSKIG